MTAMAAVSCAYHPPAAPSATVPIDHSPVTIALFGAPGVGLEAGTARVTIYAYDRGQARVGGVRLALETTAGTLTPTEGWTDLDGRLEAQLRAPAGLVRVRATTDQGVSGLVDVALQAQPTRPPAPPVVLPFSLTIAFFATAGGGPRVGIETRFTATTYPTTDVRSYAWEFDDGTPGSGDAAPRHVYTSTGWTIVTLTATSDSGYVARESRRFFVNP